MIVVVKLEQIREGCVIILYLRTPSISNYKSFQKSFIVKIFLRLIKIIERNTKNRNVKWVYYENIIKKESKWYLVGIIIIIILSYKFGQT